MLFPAFVRYSQQRKQSGGVQAYGFQEGGVPQTEDEEGRRQTSAEEEGDPVEGVVGRLRCVSHVFWYVREGETGRAAKW